MSDPFTCIKGLLCAGDVPLDRLADEFGTPLYVYDQAVIRSRIEAVKSAFESIEMQLCYSVKANSNLRLLLYLHGLDVGFDIVSGGELHRLAVTGISSDRTVFAGAGKRQDELEMAIRAGVWLITLESRGEIDLLAEVMRGSGTGTIDVALRLNVDVDAGTHRHITTARQRDKFGISLAELPGILHRLQEIPAIRPVALHMHLGSQITTTTPYRRGMDRLVTAAEEFESAGYPIRWLNAGGGFGISHQGETVPRFDEYAEVLIPPVASTGRGLILELGRSLTGPAGCLVTEVLYRKRQGDRDLLIVDAAMNDFQRPALYDAHHRILPLDQRPDGTTLLFDVAGPICESSDIFGEGRALPDTEPGMRLAIMDAGAYGMSMSGNYNSRCRPAEVWVTESGRVELIRRRETVDDLITVEREGLE